MSKLDIKFKRLTPFKRCVLQNFPFIEEDFDALTNYELLCKVVEYLNKVIESQNEVQGVTEEVVTAFNNLYDYVENYFKNLDVQEEINNKLDKMAEDGTLQEIILDYLKDNTVMKFHAVHASSATYIVEFANGKKLICDTGTVAQWQDTKAAIDGLGITKFDYVIFTHPHPDHIGNINALFESYDLSEAQVFIGMKPDFVNHADDFSESEQSYDSLVSYIKSQGITPVVPVNDSYLEIDDNTKLHFLNTSSELAENYYQYYGESSASGSHINYNDFSLVTEILNFDNVFILTGDIERPVEEAITPYVHEADVITSPHHGVNHDAFLPFYQTVKAKHTLVMTPVYTMDYAYKSINYSIATGSRIAGMLTTAPESGLLTFESSFVGVKCLFEITGTLNPFITRPNNYSALGSLIHYTQKLMADASLEDIIAGMNAGSTLKTVISQNLRTIWATFIQDINNIFLNKVTNGDVLEIFKPSNVDGRIYMKIGDNRHTYIANKIGDEWTVTGSGRLDQRSSLSDLTTLIAGLPAGNYNVMVKDSSGQSVLSDGVWYDCTINLSLNDITHQTATITAIARTPSALDTITHLAVCWFNTNETNIYHWTKIA